MAKVLRLYKDDEVVKEKRQSEEGKTTLTIDNLDSNTTYAKGTYKLAWKSSEKESDKVDVPEFTTDKIGVESVSVAQDAQTLSKGETSSINVSIQPDDADVKNVSYTSNNKEVATVTDSGEVTAVKSGNATITVKSEDNAQATAKVKVKVETPVNGVSVENENATIEVGDTSQVNATVTPDDADDKKVNYSSDNEEVATVNAEGVVTGVSEGNATVTVSSNEDSSINATINVTVEDNSEEDTDEGEEE